MKVRIAILFLAVLGLVGFELAQRADAQRARPAQVHSLQATFDDGGVHPATTDIPGPAPITCLNAVSENPNSRPVPSCHIVAPGFRGNLDKGKSANATGAGTVTLTCNGQGFLRCSARVN